MFQTFFTDTLMSRFIKHLLRANPLPLVPALCEGDYAVKGATYIYRDRIFKCLNSGIVNPEFADTANTIDVSESNIATFEILRKFDPSDPATVYNYHSKYMYYDSDTHYHLGEYLRYYRSATGINLMPYYNCFNYKTLTNVRSSDIIDTLNYKHFIVPVKFGKTYTIAIDSDLPIELESVLYDDSVGVLDWRPSEVVQIGDAASNTSDKPADTDDDEVATLSNKITKATSNFNRPFLYHVAQAPNINIFMRQRCLYLKVRIPASNQSSITVLEGDYLDSWKLQSSIDFTTLDASNVEFRPFNLALLHFNSQTSYAFSTRLIEYLLNNVISSDDQIADNIARIQQHIIAKDMLVEATAYADKVKSKQAHLGIWDKYLYAKVFEAASTASATQFLRDQDGYVNSEIEHLFSEVSK